MLERRVFRGVVRDVQRLHEVGICLLTRGHKILALEEFLDASSLVVGQEVDYDGVGFVKVDEGVESHLRVRRGERVVPRNTGKVQAHAELRIGVHQVRHVDIALEAHHMVVQGVRGHFIHGDHELFARGGEICDIALAGLVELLVDFPHGKLGELADLQFRPQLVERIQKPVRIIIIISVFFQLSAHRNPHHHVLLVVRAEVLVRDEDGQREFARAVAAGDLHLDFGLLGVDAGRVDLALEAVRDRLRDVAFNVARDAVAVDRLGILAVKALEEFLFGSLEAVFLGNLVEGLAVLAVGTVLELLPVFFGARVTIFLRDFVGALAVGAVLELLPVFFGARVAVILRDFVGALAVGTVVGLGGVLAVLATLDDADFFAVTENAVAGRVLQRLGLAPVVHRLVGVHHEPFSVGTGVKQALALHELHGTFHLFGTAIGIQLIDDGVFFLVCDVYHIVRAGGQNQGGCPA